MAEPSEWAKREAKEWLSDHRNGLLDELTAGGMGNEQAAHRVARLLDAARSGEQRLRKAIKAEADAQLALARLEESMGDDAAQARQHRHAVAVLRSLLSDAPEAGREED